MNFKQANWINQANLYEVNIRQYTPEGTFKAFGKHLQRLKQMGVQTIWLMPITPIAQKNKKGSLGSPYACSDYSSINPELGTLQDFKDLVHGAHALGMKLIIDWVANHTGWDHKWTKSHPDYYKKDTATNDFKIASGMDDIIELNYHNPEMRLAMISAMKYWVTECDIDGFRCDLAFWVELGFWMQARTELEKTKTLFWLAENDAIDHPEYFAAFDACYTWTWMHKTEDFYKKDHDLDVLKSILMKYDTAGVQKAIRLWFTTNHDENSWNGTEYEKYGDAAKALAVFSYTWNGMPLVYSGQELPNHKRLKFFDRDPIEWNAHPELEGFYKTLNHLHATNKALRAGDPAVHTYFIKNNQEKSTLAFLRKNGHEKVFVLINFSSQPLDITLEDNQLNGEYRNVFDGTSIHLSAGSTIHLKPWEYRVAQ